MFQAPKRTEFIPPPTEIDVDERYIFKLVKLTDKGVSDWADPAKNEDFHDIDWTFQIARAETKAPIFNSDGTPWEFVDNTTSKIGKAPGNKGGMVAKARLWIEAFIGHSVETDEITADTPNQLVGKFASGFFENKEIEARDGSKYTRLKVLKLSPYKSTGAPAPAPVAPPPVPTPAPVAAGAVQDDIPF